MLLETRRAATGAPSPGASESGSVWLRWCRQGSVSTQDGSRGELRSSPRSAHGASAGLGPVPPPDRVFPQRRAGAMSRRRCRASDRLVVRVPVVAPRRDEQRPSSITETQGTRRSTTSRSCSATRPSLRWSSVRTPPGASSCAAARSSRSRTRCEAFRGRGSSSSDDCAPRPCRRPDLDRQARRRGGGDEATRTEGLVVRVRGEDDHPIEIAEEGQSRHGLPLGSVAPRGGWGACTVVGERRHHGWCADPVADLPRLAEVPLGMVLTDVDPQVRDAPRRARARRRSGAGPRAWSAARMTASTVSTTT